jgi:hypothetical protein
MPPTFPSREGCGHSAKFSRTSCLLVPHTARTYKQSPLFEWRGDSFSAIAHRRVLIRRVEAAGGAIRGPPSAPLCQRQQLQKSRLRPSVKDNLTNVSIGAHGLRFTRGHRRDRPDPRAPRRLAQIGQTANALLLMLFADESC